MDEIELMEKQLHNYLIRFLYKGDVLSGVLLDMPSKKNRSNYQFIPADKIMEWRNATAHGNYAVANKLSSIVNIEDIEWAERLPLHKLDVEQRIADWKQRIKNLYLDIKTWLPENQNYTIKIQEDLIMAEELMKRFGIPQQKIASLNIYKQNKLVIIFKPSGLWMIAANGKIDVLIAGNNYSLIDSASAFTTPSWKINFSQNSKKPIVDFNKDVFLKLLNTLQ